MLYLIWTLPVLLVVFLIYIVLVSIPGELMWLLGIRRFSRRYVFFFGRFVGLVINILCGARVHIDGDVDDMRRLQKQDSGICFVSNHQSLLDIPLAVGNVRVDAGFIAKKELAYVPLLNLVVLCTHSIFLDRKNLRKGAKAIGKGASNMRKGVSMMVFPEGTRSKTGLMVSFRRGSFKLAIRSGCPVVPMVIVGSRDLVENRRSVFQTGDVYIRILEPVCLSGLDRTQCGLALDELERRMTDEYEKMRKEFIK